MKQSEGEWTPQWAEGNCDGGSGLRLVRSDYIYDQVAGHISPVIMW